MTWVQPELYKPGKATWALKEGGLFSGSFDTKVRFPVDFDTVWCRERQLDHWLAWREGSKTAVLPLLEIWRIIGKPFRCPGGRANAYDYNSYVLIRGLENLLRFQPEKGLSVVQWLRSCSRYHPLEFHRIRTKKPELLLN